MFLKRLLSYTTLSLLLLPISFSFVHAEPADHFEIEAKKTTSVGEAIDITVKAVAKDGSVDKNYNGGIFIFVDKDSKATVPYGSDGYTFTSSDAGVKTFSKGLSFTKEGKMIVTVADNVNTSLGGTYVIDVGPGGTVGATSNTLSEKISLISPEAGTILSGDTIEVVGTTKKNSKVQIFLNGNLNVTVNSDDQGQFLSSLKGISQSENTLQAKVLDGNDKIVGESEKIIVKKAEDTGAIKSFSVQQGLSVPAKSRLNVSFEAQPKLSEVKVSLGDFVETFKESSKEGVYEGVLVAPSATGTYDISVLIKTDLGKSNNIAKAASLKVVDAIANAVPVAKFENIKIQQKNDRLNFEFALTNPPSDLAKFKILYGTGKDALTTERITYDVNKIFSGGLYTWYIDGVTPATYFIKISALAKDGSEIKDLSSTPQEVIMTLNAAGTQACIVGDVSGVAVTKDKTSSIISWKTVAGVSGYKIYKKNKKGEFEFVADTKDPSYKIHIASGALKYDDFAIQALCADGKTPSANMALATKVQTGPGLVIVLALLALLGGYFYTRRINSAN